MKLIRRVGMFPLFLMALPLVLFGCKDGSTGSDSGLDDGGGHPDEEAPAGDAGDGSNGGSDDGGAVVLRHCAEQCTTDADCSITGVNRGYRCLHSLCTQCDSDAQCQAHIAGWWDQAPCNTSLECQAADKACTDIGGGVGRCLTVPGAGGCTPDPLALVTLTRLEDGSEVSVCGYAGAVCREGLCDVKPCDSNPQCAARSMGWERTCSVDGDCRIGLEVCVSVSGMGYCAQKAMEEPWECEVGTLVTLPRMDGSGEVAVCGIYGGNIYSICQAGACLSPCSSDANCAHLSQYGQPYCDTVSGNCGCAEDAHCSEAPGTTDVSVCNLVTGQCECAASTDCTSANVAVCVSGSCGCRDEADCRHIRRFDGTAWVCAL